MIFLRDAAWKRAKGRYKSKGFMEDGWSWKGLEKSQGCAKGFHIEGRSRRGGGVIFLCMEDCPFVRNEQRFAHAQWK